MTVSTHDELDIGGTEHLTRRGLKVTAIGMRREWVVFSIAVVASVLYGVTQVADAWVLGWVTDHAIGPSFAEGEIATRAVWIGVGLFILVAVLRTLGVIGRRLLGGVVYYRLMRTDRKAITRQYLRLPLSWHKRHPTGQLLSNANADVEATWAVFMPLPMAIGVVAMLVTGIVSMFLADVVLSLIAIVIFPALFVINAVYQRWQGPRLARAQSLRGDVSAVAHESFDGALVIKSLGREDDETRRFADVSHRLRDANIEVGRIRSIFDPVIETLPLFGVLAVVLVGAQRVAADLMSAGDVIVVAFLFISIAQPVRALGWVLGELPRAVVGWSRTRTVLRATDSMPYGDQTLPGAGAVSLEVDHVSLRHADIDADGPWAIDDVSFRVEPGSTTAIVGSTGSGKSVLATLIARLVAPQRGHVRLNGVDAADLTHESLAQTIALVPQSTFMFDDTVRGNVTLGLPVSDERVWEILRDVQAEEFVSALPHGLDTELGERGMSLSGGQRQRIALARALIRDPRLLVLDDATSALDPEVEQRILRSLRARSTAGTGPTIIVVAYRKATISLADRVLLLDSGRVSDVGTDADLRVRSAAYVRIVDAYENERTARADEPVETPAVEAGLRHE